LESATETVREQVPTQVEFALYASLDTEACTARGIPVCSTAGGAGTEAEPAELALGLLLAAARAIPAADANMRAGRFQEGVPIGISLAGKTIGIIGLGPSRLIHGRLRPGAEHDCAGVERKPAPEKAQAAGATRVSKDELLSRSDAISIHMVLSSRSRGLIGASDIALMKPGAILINLGRGENSPSPRTPRPDPPREPNLPSWPDAADRKVSPAMRIANGELFEWRDFAGRDYHDQGL
jgi:phosphoglycerate dehydrogenase-like enzyme